MKQNSAIFGLALIVCGMVVLSCTAAPTAGPSPVALPAQTSAATLVAGSSPVATPAPTSAATLGPTPAPSAAPTTAQDEQAQKAWREDLHFLAEQLRQRHPNPFYKASETEFQNLVDSLDRDVPRLTREQIIVGFIRLGALIDGHTHIEISQPAIGFHIYPLRLYSFSDGLFVIDAQDPYRSSIGARVVSIGHVDAEHIYPMLAPLANFDNGMTVRSIAPLFHLVPEVLRAQGIIDDVAQPAFVLEKPDGSRVTLNPTPISFDAYRRQSGLRSLVGLPQQAAPLYLSRRTELFWFTFLSDSKTLYIQYNEVQGSTQSGESISAFSQRIGTFVAQNDVQRVVVDMRHNPGGENFTYGSLLSVLSENAAINQSGKLFAIIGRQTFSAATQFATELEHSSHVLFAGEPTGGSPNLYDDTRPYTLPNSKVDVQISSRYWLKSTPDDHRPWIEPQIPSALSSQDYFNQRDPVLDAILHYTPAAAATAVAAGRPVKFNSEDGIVLGGSLYGNDSRAVILSNIGSGTQPDWQEIPQLLAQRGFMALTYDWRGFGASTGQRDYTLSDKDLGAAINYIRAQGAKQIVLVGGSLGGMASLKQAGIKELAGLGVISSPLRAPNFEVNPDAIKTIRAPKFFVASKLDTTVPYSETTAIYDIVPQPKTLQTYAGSAHGTDILKTNDHDSLVKLIVDFASMAMPGR